MPPIPPLRAAYAGLGSLGVGADAGMRPRCWPRALLVDGAVDEADEMATASEQLAGQNLKTAIGWRVGAGRGARGTWGRRRRGHARRAGGRDRGGHRPRHRPRRRLRRARHAARPAPVTRPGRGSARADAKRLYEQKGATVPAARLDDGSPGGGTAHRRPAARCAHAAAAAASADDREHGEPAFDAS